MDPTKPVPKNGARHAAPTEELRPAPGAPDRLIAAAAAADDWTPVWKAIERLIPATVTSPERLTALYGLLRGWERDDEG